MKKVLAAAAVTLMSCVAAYSQKLLDPYSGSGLLTVVTASSSGSNTSVAVAYSVRQLKTTYDHPVAITPPTAVTGFTNSTTPLLRVRRSFDNSELDIGYDANGNLDTMAVKYFVSGKVGAAGPTNPTASGYVSVWYDQSGNSRDALQTTTTQQPRIVNAGILEVNGGGVPGIAGVSGGMIGHGGNAYNTDPAGINIYGIDSNRTMNVVSQPHAWTNGTASAGDGTYLIDRNGSTTSGNQDHPLTCLKAVNNNWSAQIRNLTNDISSSFEGAVAISANRSDNVTLMRIGNSYPLYVNGIFAGSGTLVGENKMTPVRIGYGTNTNEYVYYGEFLLFPSALSNTDLTTLNNSQNVYFVLGPAPGTWTGLLSSDWNTSGNWSNNTAPTLLSEVTVPAGAVTAPVITAAQTTLSVKKLTVASGATLTINGNLTVNDTVTVNGTVGGSGTLTMGGALKQVIKGTSLASINNLTIANTADTVVATTNLNINGTLTINANCEFSALPSVVINNAANAGMITGNGTVIVTRITSAADYQSQYKFTTNTLGNLTVSYAGSGDQSINLGTNYGNLEVAGSGTKTLSAAITSTNVTGNISVDAATLSTNNLAIGSPTNRTITIAAGAVLNAGTSVIAFGSGTKSLIINGTFSTANTNGFSGTTSTAVSSTNTPSITIGSTSVIEYNATSSQVFTPRTDYASVTLTGGLKTVTGTFILSGDLLINSGASYYGGAAPVPVLTVGGDFTNNGTFTSGTATVTFNGTGPQSIGGTTSPVVFGGAVVFSGNGSTATLTSNITVASDLTISSGKIVDLDTYTANRASAGGTLTLSGTLRLGAASGGQAGSNFPSGFNTFSALSGSTVEYDGTNAMTQTVYATTYNNLILTNGSGTGTALKISTASFAVNTGSFTVNTGAQFTPAAANIISGSGTLTGSGIVDVTGTNLASQYTITNKTLTNLTINYAGGSQTIPAGTYSSLNVTGTGTKTAGGAIIVTGDVTIASGNTLDVSANNYALSVAGDFTNNGTFTQRTGTVTLNGTGSQTISGSTSTTFNNLTISKTTDTVFVNTNTSVSGTLSMGSTGNAVLYPSATTVFNSTAANGTLSGTGTILVTRIATTADLKNQYKFSTYTFTNITVNYAGLGDQTINFTSVNYSNLVVSGSGIKTIDAAITSTNVTANITINSGTFATNNLAIGSPTKRTITIDSDAIYEGGTTTITFGNSTKTIIINGTFRTAQTGGFSGAATGRAISSTNTPTITIGSGSTIEYNAASTQTITARTDYANVIFSGGSKTMPTGTTTLSGSLTINSGATYNGASNNPTVNIAGDFTNNGTFTQGTNTVTFNGTGSQSIGGTTSPTAFSNSVTFSGASSTATLAGNITVGGNLTVSTGKTLDLGSYTCNRASTGGTLSVSGTLKIGGKTGGRTGSNFPNNFNTNTMTNGTVEYDGPGSDTQTVYNITYNNLTLTNGSGSGTAVKISTSSFVVNTGIYTINLGVRFIPAAANIISGTGTMTGYGTIDVTGTSLAAQYTISGQILTNLIINYTGTTQTIAAGTYTSLSVTGGGTKTLGGAVIITGDVDIATGSTLSVGGTNSLTVGGDWTNNGTFTQGTGTVTLNGIAAQTISGTVATSFNNLTVTNTASAITVSTNTNVSGTLNMNGAGTVLSPDATVVFNSSAAAGTLSGSGKIQVTRVAVTADLRNQYKFSTYTFTTLTTEYAGAGAQTINLTGTPTINYSNIIISGSGVKTIDAAITSTNVTGDITVNSGTLSTNNLNIGSPANRTITVASGATLAAGTSVISFGATTKMLVVNGTFQTANTNGFSGTTTTSVSSTNTPTILLSSTSTVEYNAAGNQTVTFGTGANYGNLKISGSGTKTLAAAVTITNITGDIWVSAGTLSNNTGFAIAGNNDNTLSVDNAATLLLNGTSTFPTGFGTFVINDNSTVNYGGAVQSITGRQYGNLTLSGTGLKTLAGATTVNGDITVGGTAGLAASTYTLTVLGDWTNNATFTANTGSVVFAGSIAQVMQGSIVPVFNALTVNNSAGVSMSASVTVSGALTLSNGKFSIGANTLTINGTLNGSATNCFVSNGSNISFGSTGGNATLYLDQTTPGTTNRLATLTLNRTGNTLTMGSDLQTATGLTLTAGKLAIGSNTLTINGTLTSTATNSLVSNGSSNITIGGTVALGSSLFLDQTTAGTTNRLANFTYNRTSQTITLGDTVEVTGIVTPTAGTLATSNKLKLISNASGDALIAAGSGSYISGNVTVERYMPAKTSRRWRFMASPVSGATLADWKNEIYITGAGGATNGFDSTLSNQASVYSYNESAITGDLNTGWTAATNITNALTPGKGYRVFVRGDRTAGRLSGSITTQNAVTLNVVNAVNTGTLNMSPTYTSSGTLANDGWNLMGNPYPAPIDWNAFHDAGRTGSSPNYSGTDYAHLDAVVYIYDPSGNGYTSYNAFSGASVGSLSNGIIPSGAAFWVKASAASPTMSMKEIYKTTTASAGAVFKTGDAPQQFTIKLLAAADSETYDETVIKYVNEATTGFDGYDIKKMYGGDVNIASIASDASFLSANYKPFNGKSDSIMLSAGFAASGTYSFEFNDADYMVSGLPVYLVDLYTNQKVDVRTTTSYPFTVDVNNAATKGNARFVVVVGDETPTTATPEIAATETKLFLFPTVTQGALSIRTTSSSNNEVMVSITDVSGKTTTVPQAKQWNSGRIELDLSAFAPGSYFVTVAEEGKQAVTLRCVKQ